MSAIAFLAAVAAAGSISVPVDFRGEWNAAPNACGEVGSGAYLIIDETSFNSLWWGGPVRSVEVKSPREIIVTAELSGEWRTEVQTKRLRLSADGETLTEVDGEQVTVRQRCH